MAIKEIVKGICATTRCKYDVYTKEKIDGMFATVTATITNETGVSNGNTSVAYPDGFTKDNTAVISVLHNGSGNTFVNGFLTNDVEKLAIVLGNDINVALVDSAPLTAKTHTIKITLMKID
jgi:hypothetical protein